MAVLIIGGLSYDNETISLIRYELKRYLNDTKLMELKAKLAECAPNLASSNKTNELAAPGKEVLPKYQNSTAF